MHAHNLIYWALFILLICWFYRRFIPIPWIAGLASLLFVLDDAQAVSILWLANRSSILSVGFCILTLILHDKYRKTNRPLLAWAAIFSFSAGLFFQEMAVFVLGYLFAYELFLDKSPLRRRITHLRSYLVIGIIWYAVYNAYGFGSLNTAYYINPTADPLRFLWHCIERTPILLLSQFAFPPALVYPTLLPAVKIGIWILAVLALCLLGILIRKVLGNDPLVKFWIAGILLSCPIACMQIPSDRSLLFIGLGGMGLLASLIGNHLKPKWILKLILFIHIILAPVMFQLKIATAENLYEGYQTPIQDIASLKMKADQAVMIINPPAWFCYYTQLKNRTEENTLLFNVYGLGPPMGYMTGLHITRSDSSTLTLQPDKGYQHMLLRNPAHTFARGDRIVLDRLTAEIMNIDHRGKVLEVQYSFTVPLEDGSLNWFTIENGRAMPFSLPGIGETVYLPGRSFLREFLN